MSDGVASHRVTVWTAVGTVGAGLMVTVLGSAYWLGTEISGNKGEIAVLNATLIGIHEKTETEIQGVRVTLETMHQGRDRDLQALAQRLQDEHDSNLRANAALHEDLKNLVDKVEGIARRQRSDAGSMLPYGSASNLAHEGVN